MKGLTDQCYKNKPYFVISLKKIQCQSDYHSYNIQILIEKHSVFQEEFGSFYKLG